MTWPRWAGTTCGPTADEAFSWAQVSVAALVAASKYWHWRPELLPANKTAQSISYYVYQVVSWRPATPALCVSPTDTDNWPNLQACCSLPRWQGTSVVGPDCLLCPNFAQPAVGLTSSLDSHDPTPRLSIRALGSSLTKPSPFCLPQRLFRLAMHGEDSQEPRVWVPYHQTGLAVIRELKLELCVLASGLRSHNCGQNATCSASSRLASYLGR